MAGQIRRWHPGVRHQQAGGALRATSEFRMGFDSQVLMLRLELHPFGPMTGPLAVSIGLGALIEVQTKKVWGWDIVRPLNTQGFTARVVGEQSVTTHDSSSAASAFRSISP